jgi:DnaJ-class molecular chaperone
MSKTNLFTPDREINPPEDKNMVKCWDCNGNGEIVEWDEDDEPYPVKCPTCSGTGELEEEDEDEW